MYPKQNLLYVLTLLEIIEKISIYTNGYEQAADLLEDNDQIQYNATLHLLLVIGEEAKKLAEDLKNEFPAIPWKQMVGMRNYIDYDADALREALDSKYYRHIQYLRNRLT